jgi:hypothetical protein
VIVVAAGLDVAEGLGVAVRLGVTVGFEVAEGLGVPEGLGVIVVLGLVKIGVAVGVACGVLQSGVTFEGVASLRAARGCCESDPAGVGIGIAFASGLVVAQSLSSALLGEACPAVPAVPAVPVLIGVVPDGQDGAPLGAALNIPLGVAPACPLDPGVAARELPEALGVAACVRGLETGRVD